MHGDCPSTANCQTKSYRDISRNIWNFSRYFRTFFIPPPLPHFSPKLLQCFADSWLGNICHKGRSSNMNIAVVCMCWYCINYSFASVYSLWYISKTVRLHGHTQNTKPCIKMTQHNSYNTTATIQNKPSQQTCRPENQLRAITSEECHTAALGFIVIWMGRLIKEHTYKGNNKLLHGWTNKPIN